MSNSKATAVQVMGIIFLTLGSLASIIGGIALANDYFLKNLTWIVLIGGLLVSVMTGILLLGFAELIENSAVTVQLLRVLRDIKKKDSPTQKSQTSLNTVINKIEQQKKAQETVKKPIKTSNTSMAQKKVSDSAKIIDAPTIPDGFENSFVDFDCPHCGEIISVSQQVIEDRVTFSCPLCNKTIEYEK